MMNPHKAKNNVQREAIKKVLLKRAIRKLGLTREINNMTLRALRQTYQLICSTDFLVERNRAKANWTRPEYWPGYLKSSLIRHIFILQNNI